LLLARQAVAIDDSLATRSNLLAALLRSPAAIHVLRSDGGRMLSVAVAPDGRTVVAGDNRGGVLAYDTAGWRPRGSYRTGLPVRTLRFSPDGTRLAIASANESAGVLDLVDAATFRRVARRELGPGPHPFHALAFSPDSRELAWGYARWNDPEQRMERGLLGRWDARTGRSLGRSLPVTGPGEEFLVAFAGRRVVTMSEAARATVVRAADTLRPIRRLPGWGLASASAVSRDGRRAAFARNDGSIRLVDLRTGTSRTPSARHDAPVQSAAFSADGSTLVTGGDDAQVIVWDVARAKPRATFEGHAGRINGVALSPDGSTAYTASLDGTVIAWDLDASRRLGRAFAAAPGGDVRTVSETGVSGTTPASYHISASPDGGTITVGQGAGDVNLFDSRTLRLVGRIPTTEGAGVGSAAFTADGRTMAIADGAGKLAFWDARTRRRLGPALKLSEGSLWPPRFSADGRWLAVTGQDAVVRLIDARRRTQVKAIKKDQLPRDMAMRPDGKVLAVPESWGPGEGTGVEILSVPSLRRVAEIPMPSARWSRFSRDGRLLVLGDNEGRAQLYDGHTFEPRGRPLLGHAGFILTADFNPDGGMVATSSSDGTIRLWDTASGRPIGAPLPGIPNVQVGAAFTRGGTHLAAVYDNGQGYSWDVRPSSWARHACAVAGRLLTEAEWNEALPGRKYEPACHTTQP
ncbi:MAG: hypothetical protein QOJ89_2917, partial [bacterium]